MGWKPNKDRPLCPQICEHICVEIASGKLQPRQKLDSVRETAMSIGVNPNTVQRSFETLESKGLLSSVPGSGWYVAGDITPAKQTLDEIIEIKTQNFFSDLSALGLTCEEIKNYIKEWDE